MDFFQKSVTRSKLTPVHPFQNFKNNKTLQIKKTIEKLKKNDEKSKNSGIRKKGFRIQEKYHSKATFGYELDKMGVQSTLAIE